MSEFKGTKGVWIYDQEQRAILSENGYIIADMFPGDTEANSLLISKAPEMLEMLMLIENSLRRGYITDKNKLGTIQQLIKSATELK